MSDALINKYRPKDFSEVVGQDAVVRSLQANLKRNSSRTFLFTGQSGVGKTTLARIVAQEAGCLPGDLLEVDAAVNTGIDDMRAVASTLLYRPLGEGAVKAIIIDESQALSKAACQSLLKILEEPPPWAFWFLCTTEPARVPENIRTRCTRYDLKPVEIGVLIDLLEDVATQEKLKLDPKIIDLCAKEAGGSPRQALSHLATCAGVKDITEAKELLRSAIESEEAVNLARALVRGAGWNEVQRLLKGLDKVNPESVRHVVRSYLTKVALGAKTEASAGAALELLDCFSEPFNSGDGLSPLALACGRAVLR